MIPLVEKESSYALLLSLLDHNDTLTSTFELAIITLFHFGHFKTFKDRNRDRTQFVLEGENLYNILARIPRQFIKAEYRPLVQLFCDRTHSKNLIKTTDKAVSD